MYVYIHVRDKHVYMQMTTFLHIHIHVCVHCIIIIFGAIKFIYIDWKSKINLVQFRDYYNLLLNLSIYTP